MDPTYEFNRRIGVSGPAAWGTHAKVYQQTINLGVRDEMRGQRTAIPFASDDIAEIRAGHVRVANHAELVRRLRRRHLQVLSGKPGTGRVDTAVVALVDVFHGDGPESCDSGCDGDHGLSYLELDSNARLDELLSWSPDEHHSYVVKLTTGEQMKAVTLGQLRLLRNVFRSAFLILIADSSRRLGVDTHTDDFIGHVPPPPDQLLTAYLRTVAPDLPAEHLVEHERVRQNLRAHVRPQEIRHLGGRLVDGIRAGETVEQILPPPAHILRNAVREKLHAYAMTPDEESGQLGDLTDPVARISLRKLTYLASAAALDGRAQAEVLYAADRFLTRLLPDGVPRAPTAQEMVCYRADDLLEFLRNGNTNLLDIEAWESHPRVVRLAEPESFGVVLDVCWNDYPALRTPLLHWLCELAEGEPRGRPKVWWSAAQTIGHLARYDFQHFRDRVIRTWAASHRGLDRKAAADALEVIALVPTLRPAVQGLLAGWIASGRFTEQRTALMAYQSSLGRMFPVDAWTGLVRLAADKWHSYSTEIAFAIDNLSDLVEPSDLLQRLAGWSESKLPQLRIQSGRCFALLARRNAPAPDDSWPLLLRVASGAPGSLQALATIWRCGLDNTVMRRVLWHRLDDWASRRGIDPALDESIGAMLDGIAENTALRKRLVFHLRQWRRSSSSHLLDTRIEQFGKE